MTDISEIPVDVLKELWLEEVSKDDESHIICCALPDDFVGLTTAFCGRTTMDYYPEVIDDEATDISCVGCKVAVNVRSVGCPLGHDCYPA